MGLIFNLHMSICLNQLQENCNISGYTTPPTLIRSLSWFLSCKRYAKNQKKVHKVQKFFCWILFVHQFTSFFCADTRAAISAPIRSVQDLLQTNRKRLWQMQRASLLLLLRWERRRKWRRGGSFGRPNGYRKFHHLPENLSWSSLRKTITGKTST